MNRSPLFIIGLNRLIARTMRRLQLATGFHTRRELSEALGWLNRARVAAKAGLMDSARRRLSHALDCIKSARLFASIEGAR